MVQLVLPNARYASSSAVRPSMGLCLFILLACVVVSMLVLIRWLMMATGHDHSGVLATGCISHAFRLFLQYTR